MNDKKHSERGESAQQGPQQDGWHHWGLAPGDTRRDVPPPAGGCAGMCLAPFKAWLEMTAGSKPRDTTALYCSQQLAMFAALRGCKSVCIIISRVCTLIASCMWSPEKDLPQLFWRRGKK